MNSLQQLTILVSVLGGFGALLWLLKRQGVARFTRFSLAPRLPREMRVIERLSLSPQHSLCLVRFHGRTLLIAIAPTSCTLLSEGDPS